MLATLIFHDSLVNPKFLDHASVNWMNGISKFPTLDLEDTRTLRNKLYRSRRIDMREWFQEGRFDSVDMSIFLHGASDPTSGCVRIYGWKTTLLPYDPNANPLVTKQYIRVENEDFFDYAPSTFSANPGVSMFNLKVDDTWDSMQVLITQPCSAVSVYLNSRGVTYPHQFLKMVGAQPVASVYEAPVQDDFLGDNYDWETP